MNAVLESVKNQIGSRISNSADSCFTRVRVILSSIPIIQMGTGGSGNLTIFTIELVYIIFDLP
jgi:hypothetical protein